MNGMRLKLNVLAIFLCIMIVLYGNGNNFLHNIVFYDCGNVETVSSSILTDKNENKLFGLFPLGKFSVMQKESKEVILGGMPIGFSLETDGVIVVEKVKVLTSFGSVYTKADVECGDIITHLDDTATPNTDCVENFMNSYDARSNAIEVSLIRDGTRKTVELYPLIEQYSLKYRLGLEIKSSVDGVGTVTYIDSDGSFASLGHQINLGSGGNSVNLNSGNSYKCSILGYNKGEKGKAGELRGMFCDATNPIGELHKNCRFGVYGKLSKKGIDFLTGLANRKITIGSRDEVVPGKAIIVTTIGQTTDYYDIEIIKAQFQSAADEKGLVIRCTDKRLLSSTGGIIQGMSGSPIIQNGKLIGAVTHVFINDPTKGYGIYIDNMLETMAETKVADAA